MEGGASLTGEIKPQFAIVKISQDFYLRRAIYSIFMAIITLTVTMPPVAATLPPREQRIVELRAILENQDIARILERADAPIERIEWLANDLYGLMAGKCTLKVVVEKIEALSDRVGPRLFRLRSESLICAP